MSNNEEEYTDEEIEEIKKKASQDGKINRLLDDVNGIKNRLDNGLSEKVAKNSLWRGVSITILGGILIYIITGIM